MSKLDFLYITDIHGNEKKYQNVLNFALEYDVKLIHLGADILPKGAHLQKIQKKFIKGFLHEFYTECESHGIKLLGFFGNDDLHIYKGYFKEYATLLDEVPYEQAGYIFQAYGYVPDVPFSLKNACKLDYRGWPRCRYNRNMALPQGLSNDNPYLVLAMYYQTKAVNFDINGVYEILDVDKYFKEQSTIEEDLAFLPGGSNRIWAIHCPPKGLKLDVCSDGSKVGSRSVKRFIKQKQPAIVLCGHIHESYDKLGIWKAHIGKSIIIQPGQPKDITRFVYIKIDLDKKPTIQLIEV